MGSCSKEKLPPRGILTVGIVRTVPLTTNSVIHKHHHYGGAVCPSYGLGSMDPPNPLQVTSSEWVGQGPFGWF